MARIQLDLPETFLFATEIRLRFADINAAGHLGNDSLLTLLGEARALFLESYGLDELNLFGCGSVVTDAAVMYLSEVLPREVLRFEVTLGDFNKYGCDFFYRVTETRRGREVARAKTGMVFFDYRTRRVQPAPDEFRALFSGGGVMA